MISRRLGEDLANQLALGRLRCGRFAPRSVHRDRDRDRDMGRERTGTGQDRAGQGRTGQDMSYMGVWLQFHQL